MKIKNESQKAFKKTKYIVILEQSRNGYILAFINDLQEAIQFSDQAFFASQDGTLDEFLLRQGIVKPIASYSIKGNALYLNKHQRTKTDGINSIHIYKVNPSDLCIKSFIRERENSSNLLDYINESDDKELEKRIYELVDLYSFNSLWAN